MEVRLSADGHTALGGMDLIMHNERLADPLDSVTRLMGSISGKRKKTEADHRDLARVEFFGGLYTTGKIEAIDGELVTPTGAVPAIPAWNLLRCLQDGAKRHKRGPDVLRGIHPIGEWAALEYEGPTDPDEMWKSQRFVLRKGVGMRGSRIMRTRPIFSEWIASLRIEVDMEVFDIDTLSQMWSEAGRYSGLGDMRPVYGRFCGTIDAPQKTSSARATRKAVKK